MASLPVAASLSTTPWAQPPPGIESNFGPDAPDKADAVLIVSIVMMLTTTMFVTLRIILNYNHASRRLGWDDGMCAISVAFLLDSRKLACPAPELQRTPFGLKAKVKNPLRGRRGVLMLDHESLLLDPISI